MWWRPRRDRSKMEGGKVGEMGNICNRVNDFFFLKALAIITQKGIHCSSLFGLSRICPYGDKKLSLLLYTGTVICGSILTTSYSGTHNKRHTDDHRDGQWVVLLTGWMSSIVTTEKSIQKFLLQGRVLHNPIIWAQNNGESFGRGRESQGSERTWLWRQTVLFPVPAGLLLQNENLCKFLKLYSLLPHKIHHSYLTVSEKTVQLSKI